jgi:hypothetical protein
MLENYVVATQLVASRVMLSSIEFIIITVIIIISSSSSSSSSSASVFFNFQAIVL